LNEPDGDCDGKKTPQQKRSLFLSLSLAFFRYFC
jgi:hypothetical protein